MPKCHLCRCLVEPGEGFQTPLRLFCGIEHAAESALADQLKKRGRQEKKKAVAVRAEKKKIDKQVMESKKNNVSYQHNLTQKVFNKMRRLQEIKWFEDRGLVPECISCGKKCDFCCGHFKTVGSQGNLRYDETNTYLQCNKYCNSGLSGNIEGNKNTRGYKVGLAERFGEEEAARIINYCETHTEVKRWTGPELFEMRKLFSRKVIELLK